MKPFEILLAGSPGPTMEHVEAALEGKSDALVRRHPMHGQTDPLCGVSPLPSALVLCAADGWRDALSALAARSESERVPTVVIGPANDMAPMRMAMQAGVRDYLPLPLVVDELIAVVHRLERERAAHARQERGRMTAIINAKGGSGATFLASNLAVASAFDNGGETALIDLDLQFGTLPLYLDITEGRGLLDALARADSLDCYALEGYMRKHDSGVHLLANASDQVVFPGDLREGDLSRLLDVLRSSYGNVLVDLPRYIDAVAGVVLAQADRVVIVLQQSVSHVRDARRMMRILTAHLGVEPGRLVIALNRWQKRGAISAEDVAHALNVDAVHRICNDFPRVSESINLGVPIRSVDRKAAVTREIGALWNAVVNPRGPEDERSRGLFKWARA